MVANVVYVEMHTIYNHRVHMKLAVNMPKELYQSFLQPVKYVCHSSFSLNPFSLFYFVKKIHHKKNYSLLKCSENFDLTFRQLTSKLNWRQIIKAILKSHCVRTIIHWLRLIKIVSINIRWKLKVPTTINTLYQTRLENGAHLNTELSCHHLLHAHNV